MIDWKLIQAALDEDIPLGDASAQWVRPVEVHAALVARERAVVCGLDYVRACYQAVAQRLALAPALLEIVCRDGEWVESGQTVAHVRGHAHVLMAAERPALNFLMRMSGLATHARNLRERVPARITVLDTRKTTPGWRMAEKYAFRVGGLCNHRLSLSEAAMLKDSHRDFLIPVHELGPRGPISALEIEVDSPDQIGHALSYRPDALLLDNFTAAQIELALPMIPDHIRLEVSGNVSEQSLDRLPARVQYVSMGRALQAFGWIDFGLDIVTKRT